MANIKSAEKRIRTNAKKRARNKARISRLRGVVKKYGRGRLEEEGRGPARDALGDRPGALQGRHPPQRRRPLQVAPRPQSRDLGEVVAAPLTPTLSPLRVERGFRYRPSPSSSRRE